MKERRKLTRLFGKEREAELGNQIKEELLAYEGEDNFQAYKQHLIKVITGHQLDLMNCVPSMGTLGYDSFEETYIHSRAIRFASLLDKKYTRTPELFSIEKLKVVIADFDISKM